MPGTIKIRSSHVVHGASHEACVDYVDTSPLFVFFSGRHSQIILLASLIASGSPNLVLARALAISPEEERTTKVVWDVSRTGDRVLRFLRLSRMGEGPFPGDRDTAMAKPTSPRGRP